MVARRTMHTATIEGQGRKYRLHASSTKKHHVTAVWVDRAGYDAITTEQHCI
jgi:hypothetical protein